MCSPVGVNRHTGGRANITASGLIVITAIQSTGKIATAAQPTAMAVNTARRAAPRARGLERPEPAASDVIEAIGEEEEHDPDDDRGGGGGAQVPEVEHALVDEQAHGLGGRARAAAGQQEDRVEHLEGVDEPEEADHGHE